MNNEDQPERSKVRKKRGGPPPTGLEARKHSGTLCTALLRGDRSPCKNFAMNGTNVCRMHGGSAPQVRAAAQVRILMASDTAIARLVKLLGSKDERVVLAAAKDLADRANLAGTQNLEVTVEKGQTFDDVLESLLVDVEEDDDREDDDDPNVIDADEIVDDPPPMSRIDRRVFGEVEAQRTRSTTAKVGPRSPEEEREHRRREAAALASLAPGAPIRRPKAPRVGTFPSRAELDEIDRVLAEQQDIEDEVLARVKAAERAQIPDRGTRRARTSEARFKSGR